MVLKDYGLGPEWAAEDGDNAVAASKLSGWRKAGGKEKDLVAELMEKEAKRDKKLSRWCLIATLAFGYFAKAAGFSNMAGPILLTAALAFLNIVALLGIRAKEFRRAVREGFEIVSCEPCSGEDSFGCICIQDPKGIPCADAFDVLGAEKPKRRKDGDEEWTKEGQPPRKLLLAREHGAEECIGLFSVPA